MNSLKARHGSPTRRDVAAVLGSRTAGGLVYNPIPEPDGRDHQGREPVYRLKRFLKTALRAYGLRATSAIRAPGDTEPRLREADGDGEPDDRYFAGQHED